ncbi:MAG: hypothetical protein M1436_06755 [Acidobacteria bacterium]|nr:hypothetical protein [Acidobacteriota bacterium]
MRLASLLLTGCGALALAQAPSGKAPIAANPVVELKGKVTRVQIARGQGMPYLEVANGKETTRVYLGSMRYLMQQNFNPKVDSEVSLKGYKWEKDIYAISLTEGGRELKLRDANGWPMWCAGCGGGPGRGAGPGPGAGRGGRGRGRMGMGRW